MNLMVLLLLLCSSRDVLCRNERSSLDNFVVPFRALRSILQGMALENNRQNLRNIKDNENYQQVVSKDTPFPCATNNTRSLRRPETVNEVRPGDIDVIGAIGDSITAGYGLSATNLLEVLLENRGTSFTGGGEKTWREYLTLPNILKEFNPNLIGYSWGPALSIQRSSQFNVAEGGAISENMPYMTRVLIKRIQNDKRVENKRDWKMISFLIGDNDFCSEACYSNHIKFEEKLRRHEEDLVEVLRLLRDNLPRTIVNVIPPPHLKLLVEMKHRPFICQFDLPVWCPCLFDASPNRKSPEYYYNFMTQWQQKDVEIVNRPEFDRDDFTATVQPFTLNYTFPKTSSGGTDFTFLSKDCFHFSQKGNARVANDLWNNLLEPVGQKWTDGHDILTKFICPTEENPYIYTRKNSVKFLKNKYREQPTYWDNAVV